MHRPSLYDNVLSRVSAAHEDLGYDHHPPDAVLDRYVEGTLPGGSRRTQAVGDAFEQGEMSDWHRAEVGLHVKTCARCWSIVSQRRQALSEHTPETIVNPNRLRWAFARFLSEPKPLWVGASYALALLVGISVGLWLNAPFQEEDALDDVSEIMPTISSLPSNPDTALAELLRQSGIDLSPFDLDRPLISYRVQAQDSLRSIAQAQWNAPQRWIVLYLFNYGALKEMARPASDPLTPQTLRLPALK